MRLLLDTHTLLWTLRCPDKLGRTARQLIADLDNTRLVSAASPWEMGVKARVGKLPEADPILADYMGWLRRIRAQSLAITHTHALAARNLDWDHRDPFDRILAAQAVKEGLHLISADSAFDTAPGVRRLW